MPGREAHCPAAAACSPVVAGNCGYQRAALGASAVQCFDAASVWQTTAFTYAWHITTNWPPIRHALRGEESSRFVEAAEEELR